jgi:predicted nucleic acid-binding protein
MLPGWSNAGVANTRGSTPAVIPSYDAAYMAVAHTLDAPLVTLDARIAGAPGHGATIDVVS